MKGRFRISKWIMLSLAIIANTFIVVYSSLDSKTTKNWNDTFSNIYVNIVNGITKKKEKVIDLKGINIKLSSKSQHKYNYIPGYDVDEIPLGSAKEISCTFLPNNATNKAITYTAKPSDRVILNQSGSVLSVIGMKKGLCTITAKSNDGGFVSSTNVQIVDLKEPDNFDIAKTSYTVPIGSPETIEFDIDGGVLTHDELINFRYYDIGQLDYHSSDETVATVDNHGVIYPVNEGSAVITVSNDKINKELQVTVTPGPTPTLFSDLKISGSNVCYANDMIMDQSSHNHHYQLVPKEGETDLDPETFIWESFDNLLARVDRHGVLRGFRKSSFEDKNVTIKATSKITGQFAYFDVVVKNQIPTTMNVYLDYGEKKIWDKTEYTVMVGEHIPVSCYYDIKVQNFSLLGFSSNENIISITNEGNNLILHALKEGKCTVTVQSQLNPELKLVTKFTVAKSGAINGGEVESLSKILRKSLGHALVFTVAQIFTYLTLFMFLENKKCWFITVLSLGEGLFLSAFSELIQYFVPSRDGTILDVVINFSGAIVGALIAFLIVLLIIKKQKSNLSGGKNEAAAAERNHKR